MEVVISLAISAVMLFAAAVIVGAGVTVGFRLVRRIL